VTAAALALVLAAQPPALSGLHVGNGSAPFAGDGPLVTTVSPNGDGFRDRALLRFRLARPARVTVAAVACEQASAPRTVVWRRSERLGAGPHLVVWRPAAGTLPRTYVLRVTVEGGGRRRVYDNGPLSHRAPVVRVQGIDAGFTRRSYASGESATLRVATDARGLTLQVFAYSSRYPPTDRDLRTAGRPMTRPLRVDWSPHRSAPATLRVVRAGDWPSGLYFLRLAADDGRVGYAPFVVRARAPGPGRVAVVLATNTWQAYNFDDRDGNGWGDSWYVDARIRTVDLRRPYLQFGVPFRFRDWDLAFVDWLNRTGKTVHFLSDDDLEAFSSGDELAGRYDLVVFPGHEEYVTEHAYDVVARYRDLGGNLAFLSANNFFWKVRRSGERLERVALWRDVGRPEAALVGVQYDGSDHGERQAGYVVSASPAAGWAFAGTGLRPGDSFGRYGIEIDARAPSSPPGTQVLAALPGLLGPGRSAEMTYYENRAGAKVFAAGALNFAASLDDPAAARLLENVWARLSRP
jgi:N,N-dimethylformamidase beta subunit-like protein